MSEVTRYDPVNGMYHCSPGKGGYVLIGDYERLEQELHVLNDIASELEEELEDIKRSWCLLMAERDAAIKQVEGFRVLLFRCQGNLDPHRHAVLWGDLIEALR